MHQYTGQACVPQQLSAESSYPGKQPLPRTQDVASDEGEEARIVAGLGDHTQGRWTGNSSEENTYQVPEIRLYVRVHISTLVT